MQTVTERIKGGPKAVAVRPREKELEMLASFKEESESLKSSYEGRWARNLRLSYGIPLEPESTTSKVRNRSKTYFRKIWATKKRLVASLYSAFLSDPEAVKIEGRDKLNDYFRAGVLQELFNYRRDQMINSKFLVLKHTWAFEDILDYGWCVGKLSWDFDPENGVDEPDYVIWPPEQCYPDLSAETPDKMRFIIFESFLSMEEMERRK